MMKRLFILMGLFFIVGCSNGETQEVEQNVAIDDVNEVPQSDVAVRFAGIDVVTKRQSIHIEGDVQSKESHFYYTLEDEGEVLVEETMVEVEQPGEEWSTFTLEIDIEEMGLINQDVPLLTFYGKDDEKIINPNYVPVDLTIY